MNIICDLDGTIALDHKRAHYLHGPNCDNVSCSCLPKDRRWDVYFDACDTDEPNRGVITLLQRMHRDGDIKVTILSGRSMSVIDKTLAWLKLHQVPFNHLQMRSVQDRTQDDVLKLEWAKVLNLTPANTFFVLEDRQRVVNAWRKAGFRCLQVADGNF